VVDLHLHVTRGEDNRLSGTVRAGANAQSFSGTLELMRVFEELVPVEADAAEIAAAPAVPLETDT
jgi:hypothetical protein